MSRSNGHMAAKQELNLTNHDIYHPRAYRERTKDRKSLMTSTLQYQLCSLYSGKGNHSRGNISKAIWTNERSGLHSGRGQYLTGEAREQLEFKQNILFRKKNSISHCGMRNIEFIVKTLDFISFDRIELSFDSFQGLCFSNDIPFNWNSHTHTYIFI